MGQTISLTVHAHETLPNNSSILTLSAHRVEYSLPVSALLPNARGHSEMGSRDHGMVEFGVQIPMAPLSSSIRQAISVQNPVQNSSGCLMLRYDLDSAKNGSARRVLPSG
jgi:hypothetical protein